MDWFQGKSTPETIDFPIKIIWGFPVNCPLNQSIDSWDFAWDSP